MEKRLLEFDPKHPLPVTPQHLGKDASAVEIRRQLAIREQDLTYAKQRNEKLKNEIEIMKREGASAGLQERIRQLEDEKNALLDYIEENIEKHSNMVSPVI